MIYSQLFQFSPRLRLGISKTEEFGFGDSVFVCALQNLDANQD